MFVQRDVSEQRQFVSYPPFADGIFSVGAPRQILVVEAVGVPGTVMPFGFPH